MIKGQRFLLIEGEGKAFAPLAVSSKRLLGSLGLEIIKSYETHSDGGYWGRVADLEGFLEIWALLFSKAQSLGATPLALEEDSYLNALYAFKILSENGSLCDKIAHKVTQRGGEFALCEPLYLPSMLFESGVMEGKIQSRFEEFRAAWIGSPRACELPSSAKGWMMGWKKLLGLGIMEGFFSFEGYAQMLSFDPKAALAQSARLYFEAVDLGIDFILTTSASQFGMMDAQKGAILKASKRDRLETPLLYPAQLLLMALGERERKHLGIDLHQIKVEMV
ncbi:hypothetical protein [Wolinella succinogenes]|uniref:HdrB-like C-terminal domain-containing protein n=1 Tax=Wolinella succinogenes (strain ATCC 29543 / DSM 1740 / CCUG 13145 / JCM 31913 / LMG 7466 / NCTC 11488 / FDC 602W) TaxID=273121 RepID=Q7MRU2_WOLSU|nr:hypothetical protein [Wolinella succinogenes]NLU34304.1 hypothetical protein [Wolinella succinogenes]CAE10141.1 hypothetical protein WS1041 [Wolinella succinogenes]VEG82349.1 Uncharacterised protein [Wolinella succinogenes]HCZ18219.1 hypothetical protein [Helicobacter sp.]